MGAELAFVMDQHAAARAVPDDFEKTSARGGSPAEPVVDRLTKTRFGDRRDRDGVRSDAIELAQGREQVRRGFGQITGRTEIDAGPRPVGARYGVRSEQQHRLVRRHLGRVEAHAGARGVM